MELLTLFLGKKVNPKIQPKTKVIKTLIYGLKPSGNQAEGALREIANLQKHEFPRQNEIVQNDTCVDDIISGQDSFEEAREVNDGLASMLSKGNFHLKGVTFSGMDPPKNISNYKNYANVAGLKWTSKADLLSLNVSELKLGKRNERNDCKSYACGFPHKCTKSNCASRVEEVFDILGWATPITAGLKLDLSELSRRGLEWGNNIPDELVGNRILRPYPN